MVRYVFLVTERDKGFLTVRLCDFNTPNSQEKRNGFEREREREAEESEEERSVVESNEKG